MRRFRFLSTILVLVILSVSVSACLSAPSAPASSQSLPPLFVPNTAGQVVAQAPTAAPQPTAITAPTAAPTATSVPPTVAPTATTAPTPALPTQAPTAVPLAATAAPTAAPAAAAAAQAGPKTFVITEADLKNAIGSGALAANGVDVKNLVIRITGGKLHLTADSLNYSFVRLNNLDVVGTLFAQDGVLQIQIESISPGGFATAMLPNLANQALRQYSSQVYIEQVTTKEGEIDLVVR
jgi:hypothetical protein